MLGEPAKQPCVQERETATGPIVISSDALCTSSRIQYLNNRLLVGFCKYRWVGNITERRHVKHVCVLILVENLE